MNSPSESTKSPCNRNCKIEYPSKICIGCKRTIDEICSWSHLSDEAKIAINERVKNTLK